MLSMNVPVRPHNTTQSHNRNVSQTSLKSDVSITSRTSSASIDFLIPLLSTKEEPVHSVLYRDYHDLAYGDDPAHLVSYVLSSSAII
jgi:hypothetical protein